MRYAMSMPEPTGKDRSDSSATRWSQIRVIVDAVLDAPRDSRDALIAERCGADDSLRHDVLQLLASCDAMADTPAFLETPADSPLTHWADASLRAGMIPPALRTMFGERYTVERTIGEGGMAIVLLAHDHRLDRRVAIKIMKSGSAPSASRARFLEEIRLTAGLQHPGIVPIFDAGEVDGCLFFVMPVLAGATLQEQIERDGRLPIGRAVAIAQRIASALDYAHRQSVVHRDLKPANILLQNGEPIVADFGIALALWRSRDERMTGSGFAIGTPGYMSPEQVSGELTVDCRTDVYALSCILYAMLVGHPPHTGDSAQAILQRTTGTDAPSVLSERAEVPVHIAAAIARGLDRNFSARFDSAGDFARALEQPEQEGSAAFEERRADGHRRIPKMLSIGAAALLAAIVIGALARRTTGKTDSAGAQPAKFALTTLLDKSLGSRVALTPDGSAILYTGAAAFDRSAMLRPIGELNAHPLVGSAGATNPFFSPDGRFLAFFTADDRLKVQSTTGGPARDLAGGFRFSDGAWGVNDVLVIDGYASSLSRVSARGGPVVQITELDSARGETIHSQPFITPDGRFALFRVRTNALGPGVSPGELAIAPLDTLVTRPVRHKLLGLRISRIVTILDGLLLYSGPAGTDLLAVRWNEETNRTEGSPVRVLEDQEADFTSVSVARNGTLLYLRGRDRNRIVLRSPTDDSPVNVSEPGIGIMNPRVSPDGRRVVYHAQSGDGNDIWISDLSTQTRTRLTTSGDAVSPTWMPDGRRVLFMSTRDGSLAFWIQDADGVEPAIKVVREKGIFAPTVTPDGMTIVFQRETAETWSLWSSAIGAPNRTAPLFAELRNAYIPAVSPDGRWLAYAGIDAGSYQVFVRPLGAPGAVVQISDSGGTEPAWSQDGRQLFYRNGERMLAARVEYDGRFTLRSRRTLFTGDYQGGMPHRNYDVLPDGRFIMVSTVAAQPLQTVVVVNWVAEMLERLRAAGIPAKAPE